MTPEIFQNILAVKKIGRKQTNFKKTDFLPR